MAVESIGPSRGFNPDERRVPTHPLRRGRIKWDVVRSVQEMDEIFRQVPEEKPLQTALEIAAELK